MKIAACYKNAVKLGLYGALGMANTAMLIMLCGLSGTGVSYPPLVGQVVVVALPAIWLATPFLVSILAVRRDNRREQGMLAGYLATGLGTVASIVAMIAFASLYIKGTGNHPVSFLESAYLVSLFTATAQKAPVLLARG